MTHILIAGSRSWQDYQSLKQAWQDCLAKHNLSKYAVTIVSGGAQGADKLAERLAQEEGIAIEIYRPDWQRHGNKAGMIRNAEMVAKAQQLIALWDGQSKGTAMTINTARRKGLSITVVQPNTQAEPWQQLAL